MRLTGLLALATILSTTILLACDAIVEEPPPPRARFVRPAAGGEFRNLSGLTVEVSLENCSSIDSFEIRGDDRLILRVDFSLEYERQVYDCSDGNMCALLWPSDLMDAGILTPVELRAEVKCRSSDFSARTDPLAVAVSPFSGSVVLPAGVDPALEALPNGRVAVQTDQSLYLVDAKSDSVVATLPGAGRIFRADSTLYQLSACRDSACGAAGQLAALSTTDLAVDSGPVAVDCAPTELVRGPGATQVTVLGRDSTGTEICWEVYDSALERVMEGTHARVGLKGARRTGLVVRMLATDGAQSNPALFNVDIRGLDAIETNLAVSLIEPTAAALADDGSWALVAVPGDLRRIELGPGTIGQSSSVPLSSDFDAADTMGYEAIPASAAILAWSRNSLLYTDSSFSSSSQETHRLAFGSIGNVVSITDRRVIEARAIRELEEPRAFGPFPETWQEGAHAAGVDSWFHIAFASPLGTVIGSIDADRVSP